MYKVTHRVWYFRVIADEAGLALEVESLKVDQALELRVDVGVGVVSYHLVLPLQQRNGSLNVRLTEGLL
jgi:hypothetical protein